MKKLMTLAVAAIMVVSALTLTACGGGGSSDQDLSDSKYVGTWKSVSFELMDESESPEEGEEIFMTLNGDGTGTMTGTSEGEEETSDFTWEPTSNGFKTKGDLKLKFTDDGDKIKATVIGVDMIFEKQ
ncbi:hypothetical protein [Eubacterium sp. AB3007]|jgi:ABC-type glycerol-3-phosphate transport system substrate-binding protein|uniref:hypothetical protein n=1 Tax=Eubacterium sp. AB3007 TaxID=1392487 RepID=UPI00048877FF|nr:hypothetical protein [Eubacterium sp. AB3007]